MTTLRTDITASVGRVSRAVCDSSVLHRFVSECRLVATCRSTLVSSLRTRRRSKRWLRCCCARRDSSLRQWLTLTHTTLDCVRCSCSSSTLCSMWACWVPLSFHRLHVLHRTDGSSGPYTPSCIVFYFSTAFYNKLKVTIDDFTVYPFMLGNTMEHTKPCSRKWHILEIINNKNHS